MPLVRRLVLILLVVLAAIACKGGGGAAGKYRIEQTNNFFGEGAEKGELNVREDGTYDITMGPLTLFKGNWSAKGNDVSFTEGTGKLATSYKLTEGKLIPYINGKEMTQWRFIRK
jgi:hypothetical protein